MKPLNEALELVSKRLGLPCKLQGDTIVVESPTGIPLLHIDTYTSSGKVKLAGFGSTGKVGDMIWGLNHPEDDV